MECLLDCSLVQGVGQNFAASSTPISVSFPTVEHMVQLASEEAILVLLHETSNRLRSLLIHLIHFFMHDSKLSSASIGVLLPHLLDSLNLVLVVLNMLHLHRYVVLHGHYLKIATRLAPSDQGLPQRIPQHLLLKRCEKPLTMLQIVDSLLPHAETISHSLSMKLGKPFLHRFLTLSLEVLGGPCALVPAAHQLVSSFAVKLDGFTHLPNQLILLLLYNRQLL